MKFRLVVVIQLITLALVDSFGIKSTASEVKRSATRRLKSFKGDLENFMKVDVGSSFKSWGGLDSCQDDSLGKSLFEPIKALGKNLSDVVGATVSSLQTLFVTLKDNIASLFVSIGALVIAAAQQFASLFTVPEYRAKDEMQPDTSGSTVATDGNKDISSVQASSETATTTSTSEVTASYTSPEGGETGKLILVLQGLLCLAVAIMGITVLKRALNRNEDEQVEDVPTANLVPTSPTSSKASDVPTARVASPSH